MDYNEILRKSNTPIKKDVQKALLCVYDLSSITAGKRTDVSSTVGAAMALENALHRATGIASIQREASTQGFKVMKVQFNPNELSFSSSPVAGKKDKKDGNQPDQLLSKAVQTVLTVPLIFEEIKETDAFTWDKQQALFQGSFKEKIEASSLASTIMNYSVKTQIDGLLSLLANSTTRNIVLCWGNISLSGMIQSEQAEYTMFNPSGNPIMGTVTLKIILNRGANKTASGKYWNKAFDQLFTVKRTNTTENVTNTMGTISKLVKFNQ